MFGVSPRILKEAIKAYTYVLVWMSVSIAVIVFNKWLLAFSGFPYPITLTLWHMLFCSTIAFFVVRVLKLVKAFNMSTEEYLRRVMPIGVLYAASLWLSNSSYLYLSVSFIQMTKSLMPGLVFACGCMVGTEKFKTSVLLNMLLIAFGVVVCAMGEVNLSLKGLSYQLSALLFEALRLTLVQVLINSKGYKMNPMQSLYYISPACMIALIVPFLAAEFRPVRALLASPTWVFRPSVFLANAGTAFALNLAVFLLIGKTSALTMNIAGVIKDWLLISFSYYGFKAPVTTLNLLGYLFCCSGVGVYNYLKLAQAKAAEAQKQADGGGKIQDSSNGFLAAGKKKEKDEDEEYGGRSKDEIMSEMRRLQAEMARLESRMNHHSN